MLHTFLEKTSFRHWLERELDALARELEREQLDGLDPTTLRRRDLGEARAGSKPLLTLCSAAGACYAFKQCDAPLAAAEQAAYELRRLGRRPALPARVMTVQLEEEGPLTGLVKPYLDFNVSAELATDTTTWTEAQRAVMLAEHAWEWFLDNLDTNTSQYALLGPLRLPINIDWDRSFSSDARCELSRFTKYKPQLPNARNFMYADYVAGKLELPLWTLANEARRIRRLPVARVRGIIERYAVVRFDDAAEREQFVRRVLIRQRCIEREVGSFMRSLWSERRALRAPAGTFGTWLRRIFLVAWAGWQRVLNGVLRGPVGTVARRALSAFRGWRSRHQASAGPGGVLPSPGV